MTHFDCAIKDRITRLMAQERSREEIAFIAGITLDEVDKYMAAVEREKVKK